MKRIARLPLFIGLVLTACSVLPAHSDQVAAVPAVQEPASQTIISESPTSSVSEKYDWQTDIIFFSDSVKGFPALAVTGRKGKSGWVLLYANSELPYLRKKAVFMRSEGVPIKTVTTQILVPDGSTATYRQDLLDDFSTRVQVLELFYYRQVYAAGSVRAGLLAGLPLVWHDYSAACALDDNSRFNESGSAFGIGVTPGLVLSFGAVTGVEKGLVGSMFLLYNKFWFDSSGGKLSGPLRSRLNGARFGFSVAWHFGRL